MTIATALATDWTRDPITGRSNSSETFVFLCEEVEKLIRGSSADLINGRVNCVAGLIVTQLAHKHRLIPGKFLDQ